MSLFGRQCAEMEPRRKQVQTARRNKGGAGQQSRRNTADRNRMALQGTGVELVLLQPACRSMVSMHELMEGRRRLVLLRYDMLIVGRTCFDR